MVLTKKQLLNKLDATNNNFLFGIMSFWVNFKKHKEIDWDDGIIDLGFQSIDNNSIKTHSIIDLNSLLNSIDIGKNFDFYAHEYLKMLLRTHQRESFENIKSYCEDTQQNSIFKKADWYQFARLTRNGMAHNFRWAFSQNDKIDIERSPITWQNKVLTTDMDDTEIKISFFGWNESLELYKEMRQFVVDQLK